MSSATATTHSLPRRFWAKVERTDGCWLWIGRPGTDGYGRFLPVLGVKRMALAHRVAYEALIGPIPAGLTIDHLCRVRNRVNPDHMEPVTRGENTLRGLAPSAVNARKTACRRGHDFTPENTRIRGDGSRRCRRCDVIANAKQRERARARNAT